MFLLSNRRAQTGCNAKSLRYDSGQFSTAFGKELPKLAPAAKFGRFRLKLVKPNVHKCPRIAFDCPAALSG
jgi:hypothetical protein